MKIIHLIGGGDEGGAKSHVLQLVKALGEHIDVTLISFRKGRFHDDAVAMGIDARVIHSGNIISDVKETLRLVREGGYEIIHSHGAKANMIGTIIKRLTGIPVVTTVHSDYRLDYMHSFLKRFSFGVINMISLRKINYHISVSNNFKEMLMSRGFNPQRIFTVYNGIPFNNVIPPCSRKEFFEQYHIPFPLDSVVIGIMARLHPVKDHETFLNAAAMVVKGNPKARFIIGGPGDELLPHLEEHAKKLGIRDYVCFTGMIDKPFDFFQSIDINTLTSISESFPYVILEGARFSRATVSTHVGGLGDLIESGKNGYLVKPRDWKKLGEHLLKLSLDEEKRNAMGQALRQKAEQLFSLDNMRRTQLEIYDSILAAEKRFKKDGKLYDMALLGYYGYKNSGDEAILKATIKAMRDMNRDLTFVVLSKTPKETMMQNGVDSINRFNLFKAVRMLKKSRLFLAGGGSLIQDNTSTRSIIYYLLMLKIAKKCGVKAMLFANGIGPINRKVNRNMAAKVLNTLDAITLRDPVSFDEIKRMGISKPEIYVTSDPAILLEPAGNSEVLEMMEREGIPLDKPLIGFSVRKWGDSGFVDGIAQIADYCAEHFNACPVMLPMQHPSDCTICDQIIQKMKQPAAMIRGIYSPELILGFTGRLSLLVGMRLHSLVYASNRCVPLLGLVYEPKVEAFINEIGQVSGGKVDQMDYCRICSQLDDIWQNREQISTDLRKSNERLVLLARSNINTALHLLENIK